ncbi:MAG: hypothetical protein JNM28_06270 [Armatimonadetes bacterium]|nr:hypothetical protein [Armatimonadota bacterium]MBS1711609.1 hypothetical protein [Armatimonadota bacterium]MBX3109836.1 hypothetical protein [Fimbriimonadaceae bacterium]
MQTAHHNDKEPLDPKIAAIYRTIAGEYADKYLATFLIPQLEKSTGKTAESLEDWVEVLDEPEASIRVFLGAYAYARRGKDRDLYARTTLRALDQVLESTPIDELLTAGDGVALWDAFIVQCERRAIKPNESQNRGIVQGIPELAQEIFALDGCGSICGWVADGIEQTSNIEPQFNRIVDIRGVGPKSTSTFLRDLVLIYGLEAKVNPADRIHIQPVDRWTRLATTYCVPEPHDDRLADWIVAGKVNKYARRAKVSGIRFNLGLTYFGQRVVREPSRFDAEMKALIARIGD